MRSFTLPHLIVENCRVKAVSRDRRAENKANYVWSDAACNPPSRLLGEPASTFGAVSVVISA